MIRPFACGCFVAVLVTSALVLSTPPLLAQDDEAWPAIVRMKPLLIDDGDDELLKLQKTVFNSAIREIQISFQCYRFGLGDLESHIDSLYAASRRLADAALELDSDEADRVEFLQGHVTMAIMREAMAEARWLGGGDSEIKYHRARFDCLTAKIELTKARLASEAKKKTLTNK